MVAEHSALADGVEAFCTKCKRGIVSHYVTRFQLLFRGRFSGFVASFRGLNSLSRSFWAYPSARASSLATVSTSTAAPWCTTGSVSMSLTFNGSPHAHRCVLGAFVTSLNNTAATTSNEVASIKSVSDFSAKSVSDVLANKRRVRWICELSSPFFPEQVVDHRPGESLGSLEQQIVVAEALIVFLGQTSRWTIRPSGGFSTRRVNLCTDEVLCDLSYGSPALEIPDEIFESVWILVAPTQLSECRRTIVPILRQSPIVPLEVEVGCIRSNDDF